MKMCPARSDDALQPPMMGSGARTATSGLFLWFANVRNQRATEIHLGWRGKATQIHEKAKSVARTTEIRLLGRGESNKNERKGKKCCQNSRNQAAGEKKKQHKFMKNRKVLPIDY